MTCLVEEVMLGNLRPAAELSDPTSGGVPRPTVAVRARHTTTLMERSAVAVHGAQSVDKTLRRSSIVRRQLGTRPRARDFQPGELSERKAVGPRRGRLTAH